MSPPDTGQGESKSRGDEDSFTIRQYPGLVKPSWDSPGFFSCPWGARGQSPRGTLPLSSSPVVRPGTLVRKTRQKYLHPPAPHALRGASRRRARHLCHSRKFAFVGAQILNFYESADNPGVPTAQREKTGDYSILLRLNAFCIRRTSFPLRKTVLTDSFSEVDN
jgi:hypothetical protein